MNRKVKRFQTWQWGYNVVQFCFNLGRWVNHFETGKIRRKILVILSLIPLLALVLWCTSHPRQWSLYASNREPHLHLYSWWQSMTASLNLCCIAILKVWFLMWCASLDRFIVISAIEVLLSNRAGNTCRTWGGVICGSQRIFFLSYLALYSFIVSREPFKEALNTKSWSESGWCTVMLLKVLR
jgi:hypothetical protein